jgi:hypothetical protein
VIEDIGKLSTGTQAQIGSFKESLQRTRAELESRMKQAELQWEWKEVIRGLEALQQVEANFQGRRFLFRSHLTANASQAVRATIQISHPRSHRDL